MFSLDGKTAIVTGGTRGIGRAISLSLAKAGARILLNYRSNDETAHETVGLIKALGAESALFKGDAAKAEVAQGAIDEAIKCFGKVDILVNNAGRTADNLLLRMSEEEWDSVIEANLRSTFLFSRAALRPMIRQRAGRIISISSIDGLVGNAGQANYSAAKAGQIGFTKSLAREVASRGITVNAIAPGIVRTGMTEVLTDGQWQKILDRIPMGRDGAPEEIAPVVDFPGLR